MPKRNPKTGELEPTRSDLNLAIILRDMNECCPKLVGQILEYGANMLDTHDRKASRNHTRKPRPDRSAWRRFERQLQEMSRDNNSIEEPSAPCSPEKRPQVKGQDENTPPKSDQSPKPQNNRLFVRRSAPLLPGSPGNGEPQNQTSPRAYF
jgi:hypothetical protein